MSHYGFLVANFGNNVSPDFEKLNVHYSPDGKYVAAGTQNPVYSPASTRTSGVRDPSVRKYNGRWYCAHTINGGEDKTFEIAVSDDLVNWSLHTTIDVSSVVDSRAWAPELALDDDGSMLIHFTNVKMTGDSSTHTIWWIRSQDANLKDWSAPVRQCYAGLTAPRPIDPSITKGADGTWHIFYGNDGSIEHATAKSPTEVWTVVGVGDWAGWAAGADIHYEGPEIVQVAPDKWRIYLDRYVGKYPYTTVGYFWSETSDFVTWTPPIQATRSPGYPDGYALRHGSWLPLESAEDQMLVLAATSAGGPEPIRHAEYTGTGAIRGGQPWDGNLVKDKRKSSVHSSNIVAAQGRAIRILQNGIYSVDLVAPCNVARPLGGGWLAIKGAGQFPIHASTDVVSSSAAQSVSASNLWLINGDLLEMFVTPANSQPSDFQFRVRITKLQ